MIVSFKHRFIFVAIPKTATHSFRNALRPYLDENDWEQCVLFEKKLFPVKELAEIGHGHISCTEIRPFLLPEMWENYFRFCAVRNPYSRFLSYCRFINRDNQKMTQDPLGTMKKIICDQGSEANVMLRPQYKFVTDEDGLRQVDFVARLESLKQDFDHICKNLGLLTSQLGKINSSVSGDISIRFDKELNEMVRSVYQKDFELFGYDFEPPELEALISVE